MSSLVNFILAAVLSLLQGDIPKEEVVILDLKVEICDTHETIALNSIITKNEPLYKVKGIR
jgi:hypothetical protein